MSGFNDAIKKVEAILEEIAETTSMMGLNDVEEQFFKDKAEEGKTWLESAVYEYNGKVDDLETDIDDKDSEINELQTEMEF